jgi:hypothetical protein
MVVVPAPTMVTASPSIVATSGNTEIKFTDNIDIKTIDIENTPNTGIISKINSNGIWQWDMLIKSTENVYITCVSSKTQYIYVTGYVENEANMDFYDYSGIVTKYLTSAVSFIACINSNTQEWIWCDKINDIDNTYLTCCALIGNDVLVTGYSNIESKYFVTKYNSVGSNKWNKLISGSIASFKAFALNDGNAIVKGYYTSQVIFDDISNQTLKNDLFCVKINTESGVWISSAFAGEINTDNIPYIDDTLILSDDTILFYTKINNDCQIGTNIINYVSGKDNMIMFRLDINNEEWMWVNQVYTITSFYNNFIFKENINDISFYCFCLQNDIGYNNITYKSKNKNIVKILNSRYLCLINLSKSSGNFIENSFLLYIDASGGGDERIYRYYDDNILINYIIGITNDLSDNTLTINTSNIIISTQNNNELAAVHKKIVDKSVTDYIELIKTLRNRFNFNKLLKIN